MTSHWSGNSFFIERQLYMSKYWQVIRDIMGNYFGLNVNRGRRINVNMVNNCLCVFGKSCRLIYNLTTTIITGLEVRRYAR